VTTPDQSAEGPVVGVDFSGAADAGARIWIADGVCEDRVLHVKRLFPAMDLHDSGRGRDASLRGLRNFLAATDRVAVGIDAPLSLPDEVLGEERWDAFVQNCRTRFPCPGAFREWCLARAGGAELRRPAEQQAGAPFSAYNLRLYRQKYYALTQLLAPLTEVDAIRAWPMQKPRNGKPLVMEACPAGTLKRLDLYAPYKGTTARRRLQRERILHALTANGSLAPLDAAARQRALANVGGDALDAVLAAVAVCRWPFFAPPADLREGVVVT
jgi:hypothetical protein